MNEQHLSGREDGFVFRGKRYASMKQACEELGIHYSTFHTKKRNGQKSPQDILEGMLAAGQLKPTGKRDTSLWFRNRWYPSVKDACSELGLVYVTVMARKKRLGQQVEDVLEAMLAEQETGIKFDHVEFRGKHYPSVKEACRELGIPYSTYSGKKKKDGGEPQDVLEAIMNGKAGGAGSGGFTFRGKRYASVKQACEKLGISYHTFHARKRALTQPDTAVLEELLAKRNRSGRRDEGD